MTVGSFSTEWGADNLFFPPFTFSLCIWIINGKHPNTNQAKNPDFYDKRGLGPPSSAGQEREAVEENRHRVHAVLLN